MGITGQHDACAGEVLHRPEARPSVSAQFVDGRADRLQAVGRLKAEATEVFFHSLQRLVIGTEHGREKVTILEADLVGVP
jgi:hypothetical protein